MLTKNSFGTSIDRRIENIPSLYTVPSEKVLEIETLFLGMVEGHLVQRVARQSGKYRYINED